MEQDQFLEVIDRDEAERRFRSALDLHPLPEEQLPLGAALHQRRQSPAPSPTRVVC
jgi:hypothetical protein